MPVAGSFRRSAACFPRDRTQGYAALGFLSRAAHRATLAGDPAVWHSTTAVPMQPSTLPDTGPDALGPPPPPECEEGRLVPRSPFPDRTWIKAARLLAAGYSVTETSARCGIGTRALQDAWVSHRDFRVRVYWEYHAMVRAARARLRAWNAVMAPEWKVGPEERAEWAAIEAASATRSSTNDDAEAPDRSAESTDSAQCAQTGLCYTPHNEAQVPPPAGCMDRGHGLQAFGDMGDTLSHAITDREPCHAVAGGVAHGAPQGVRQAGRAGRS